MKCDRCDKQATVHLIEIKNGQKIEKHLCEGHAVEEGVAVKVTTAPINELLEKFVLKQAALPIPTPTTSCRQCGLTYEDFRRTGLLGCPTCYESFADLLKGLLERAHEGATEHLGKVPARAGIDEARQKRLLQLRRELQDAVANEQYEKAANLRDLLAKVESGQP